MVLFAAGSTVSADVLVLLCAGVFALLFQALFPRSARWPVLLFAVAAAVGFAALYASQLSPGRLSGISDPWSALRAMVLAAGLPEEAVKLAATLLTFFVFARSLRPAEAAQASLMVALGFALFENLSFSRLFPEAGMWVVLGRAVFGSFAHSMMGMIQGFFLAGLVRSGWRRLDLVALGYLIAAAAHSLYNWGLVRPMLAYQQDKSVDPETAAEALQIAVPCVLSVVLLSLFLFSLELRRSGGEDPLSANPEHQVKVARWRRVGGRMIGVGVVGIVGSLAVLATRGALGMSIGAGETPEPVWASALTTVAVQVMPMLTVIGVLVRNKR